MGKLIVLRDGYFVVGGIIQRLYTDPVTQDAVAEFADGSVDRVTFEDWHTQTMWENSGFAGFSFVI